MYVLFDVEKIFKSLSYETIDVCLSKEEVETFEHNNKIIFPEQYREFLLYIGNGVQFKNGKIIKGIKRPVEKQINKRSSYRFLFKEGMNAYLNISPKPYPRYDGKLPQYDDCIDPENWEEGCNKCQHYMECIDTDYDIYSLDDSAYFNGCHDLDGMFYLIVSGD